MKTYTYKVKGLDTNNNASSFYSKYDYSYTNSLKSTLADNLANKYPWMAAPATSTCKISINDYAPSTNLTVGYFNFDTDYANAIAMLEAYANKLKANKIKTYKSDFFDEYDFEIGGIPVRIFGDMIQIGNRMLLKNASSSYYNKLSSSLKKDVLNIIIKIKY